MLPVGLKQRGSFGDSHSTQSQVVLAAIAQRGSDPAFVGQALPAEPFHRSCWAALVLLEEGGRQGGK